MIVFIDGLSTTGKTTTINMLKEKIGNKNCYIYLENDENHLLRPYLNKYIRISEDYSYKDYIDELIKAWERILNILNKDDAVYVFDGYILHELERTFLMKKIPWEFVCLYYDRLNSVLCGFDSVLFMLYREEIGKSVIDTFRIRSDKWRSYKLWQISLIKGDEISSGEELDYVVKNTQKKMKYIYERFTFAKEMIETSDENWNLIVNKMIRRIKNEVCG